MAAFKAALDGGYGIEFDLHLLADGDLAVMHDSLLKRTTGAEGRIEDLTTEDLKNYHLEGTEETIPTFRQLLDLYAGKAPLIVELKPLRNNHEALVDAAVAAMEGYEGPWCMESFDPRCIYVLKKKYPHIIRGQLSENFLKNDPKMNKALAFVLSHYLENFLTVPDFVAYRFDQRNSTISTKLCRGLWKAQGVVWTLRKKEDHPIAVEEGWLPIFENYIP
jgi:glycerophosphoryl diester phosphodiesterase